MTIEDAIRALNAAHFSCDQAVLEKRYGEAIDQMRIEQRLAILLYGHLSTDERGYYVLREESETPSQPADG